LDTNHPVVTENGVSSAGACVLLETYEKPAPHLVISPYSDQYEERTTSNLGIDILIRPNRPEDIPLFWSSFLIFFLREVSYYTIFQLQS
jgi:hypothetical protein